MKLALCNEMFPDVPLERVCAVTKRLGYEGIEIAPFTLAEQVGEISSGRRREIKSIITDQGLQTVGLHWLLAGSDGLHITTQDESVWDRTRDYLKQLIDLCHDLGGEVMVFGSPKQRSLLGGQTFEGAWQRAVDMFGAVLDQAKASNVMLCLEPLTTKETDFINTAAQGMEMVRQLNHPNFKIHLDVKAMCGEAMPVADIIRSVPVADIGHIHVNDENLYGPGMGQVDYAPIFEALGDIGWDRWLSVEVFKYDPDGETIARRSIEYLKSFL